MMRPALLGIICLGLASCVCGAPGSLGPGDDAARGCSDQDGDGYGVGADCLGSDCDDLNPSVQAPEECEALCDVDPTSTGCACDEAEPIACYTGPADSVGVGACREGTRRCVEGAWSGCEGQVLPGPESCNDTDDDCDGEVDEGGGGECGVCDDDCNETCIGEGEGCDDFDVENEGNGVVECEGQDDCVTLGGDTVSLQVIWIANSSQGSVSKVNTRTREEEARYYTGSSGEAGFGVWGGGIADLHGGLSPSRTSVGFWGDVVVGNRNFNAQPSATKILASSCPDRDGDGAVRTSTGRDDLLAWTRHLEWEDECIVWHTDVGERGGIARAVAVQERAGLDGVLEERVWIGVFSDRRFYELDGWDGAPTGVEVDVSPATPYGAAIDREGNLWCAGLSSGRICRFDTDDPDDVETIGDGAGYSYGITVDENGKVWLGGNAQRYDPDRRRFTRIALPGEGATTGVAADGNGSIWFGAAGRGPVYRVDAETAEHVSTIDSGSSPYGIGVDFEGYIWGIGRSDDNVAIIDPETEDVEIALDGCDGGGCLIYPYTYSDMTGFQLRNATNPMGDYTHVFVGCGPGSTTWTAIRFEAVTPPGSAIEFSVRTAEEIDLVARTAWVSVGAAPALASPAAIEGLLAEAGQTQGNLLEVRARLQSLDRIARPMLLGLGATYACEPFIE